MDIDGLKRINDSFGHQAGDRVLMQVGCRCAARSARWTPRPASAATSSACCSLEQDLKSAAKLAARLATAVEEEVAAPGEPPVTISIGVASSPEHGDEAETLIDTADRAMYRAKAAGEGIALGDPPGRRASRPKRPRPKRRCGYACSKSARVDSSMCGRSASAPSVSRRSTSST